MVVAVTRLRESQNLRSPNLRDPSGRKRRVGCGNPRRERQRALAWLDDVLGAYPNLWPHIVPIITAAIGVVGAVAVALLS
jgi:hypothetical protein